jgi:integrase
MARRHQRGYVYRRGHAWFVRYSDQGVQRARRLADVELCRTKSEAKLLAQAFLAPINEGRGSSAMTLEQFVARVYLPATEQQKRISTYRGYRNLWLRYLSPHGAVLLRDFHTAEAEHILATVAQRHRLNVRTLAHIKAFLSGVLRYALRQGVLTGENPVREAVLPKASPANETYAYSTEEIDAVLGQLAEPLATIVATAAFTGLRKGEIRGLEWPDFDKEELHVRRAYWRSHVDEPKTAKSKAPVPVIAKLAARLERLHERARISCDRQCANCQRPIFPARADARPVNLDRLTPALRAAFVACGLCWRGWHAFRRGLATNLHRLGVADKTIQRILRHSNVAVTQAAYIKSVDADLRAAIGKLDAEETAPKLHRADRGVKKLQY